MLAGRAIRVKRSFATIWGGGGRDPSGRVRFFGAGTNAEGKWERSSPEAYQRYTGSQSKGKTEIRAQWRFSF